MPAGLLSTIREGGSNEACAGGLARAWRGFCLGCVFLLVQGSLAKAQPVMSPLLSNGPISNRFNIAFLSEGYTPIQLNDFRGDATNALTTLLSRPPFSEYRAYFNAWAISVASAESGSDHPASGIYRDTYFNTTYSSNDSLIAFPANSQGQGKVDALLPTMLPECDLAVLLVNDPISGGSDGNHKTAIASTGFMAGEFMVHEIGHVMAGLGDEYETAYPGFPAVEEPNTTRETNRSAIKWKAWLTPGTPVPTPETSPYASFVGLFEGAHYNSTGWFRPRLDCAMRSSFVPFCEVCSEALVLALYQRIRPIDSWAPTNLVQSWPDQSVARFGVTLQTPFSHSLSAQWLTNGVEVPGATGSTFSVVPSALGQGARSVTVRVRDNTSLVRNDPAGYLTQTVTWNELRVISPLALPDGKFAFRVVGDDDRPVAIQASADFVGWNSIATNVFGPGNDWFTNFIAGNPRRFYRVVMPPR